MADADFTKKAEKVEEQSSETGGRKQRQFTGAMGLFTRCWFALLPIAFVVFTIDLPLRLFNISPYPEQYIALFLAIGMPSVFLCFKAHKKAPGNRVPWYDYIPAAISLIVFLRLAWDFENCYFSISHTPTDLVISGFFAVVLVLEAARRLLGMPLLVVGLFFVLYTHFCYLAPKPLTATGEPWDILFCAFYADYSALMGMPVGVISSMLVGFLLFGAALFATGGGTFFSDIAMSIFGSYQGGAAKTTVVGSALFGSISGSPAANVAITGTVTIPLMKRTGFSGTFAAAVEASSSTGGVILPPVMGISAFIMAEFLRVPYYQVALAAAIPAILYYVALYIQVHLESLRQGVTRLDRKDLPSTRDTLRTGWVHLIPIAALFYFMFFERMPPGKAGLYTTVIIFALGLARKSVRADFLSILWKCLIDTGRQTILPMAACCVAALVIGSVSMTNLGTAMSYTLTHVAGGSMLLLLFLAAGAAIILGMGMPIAATYILTATLMAPAMIALGLAPMAAHMFLTYFGAMSFLTPPVCIAAFVAASIADSPMMRTGITSTRIAVVAFVVPFAFCYNPALLGYGYGTALQVVSAVLPLVAGIIFFSIGNAGYLRAVLPTWLRLIFAAAGLGMLIPETWSTITGLCVGLAATAIAWFFLRPPTATPATQQP